MQIKLIAVGKTDHNALQTLIDDYTKRLSHYIKFEYAIIPDIKNAKNLSENQQKQKEGELILAKPNPVISSSCSMKKGKAFDSVAFSKYLQKHLNSGVKQVTLLLEVLTDFRTKYTNAPMQNFIIQYDLFTSNGSFVFY